MSTAYQFTFANLKRSFERCLAAGYKIITCREYVQHKARKNKPRVLVNRVDIDFSINKAKRLAELFNELGIKGSFFVRLHAKEYNPLSFQAYKVLKFIRDSGHEIGYHSEIVDQAAIWDEPADKCLMRDIKTLEDWLDIKIDGVASHSNPGGLNNLDFWQDRKPSEFGLMYEAYDKEPEFNLFHESLYVSDSCWTYWKAYYNGHLISGDNRSPDEHAQDGLPVIYTLIHPDTYFDDHFFE